MLAVKMGEEGVVVVKLVVEGVVVEVEGVEEEGWWLWRW